MNNANRHGARCSSSILGGGEMAAALVTLAAPRGTLRLFDDFGCTKGCCSSRRTLAAP